MKKILLSLLIVLGLCLLTGCGLRKTRFNYDDGINDDDYDIEEKEETPKKGKELDFFKDIDIQYENYSPYITIKATNTNEELKKYNIWYDFEIKDSEDFYKQKMKLFANGDTIIITAKYNNYQVEEDGYTIPKPTMEITIKNQGKYIESIEELNDDIYNKINGEMISEVQKVEAKTIRSSYCSWYYCYSKVTDDKFKIDKVTPMNMYLGINNTVRRGNVYDDNNHTAIIGVYKINFEADKAYINADKERFLYCVVWYDNMYLNNNGRLSDYTKDEYHLSCKNYSLPVASDMKNHYNTSKYQYSDVLQIK